MVKSAFLAAALLASALPVVADETTGAVRGVVKDPTGAHVPGARVEIAGPGGRKRPIVTDESGAFAVEGLRPGVYSVIVTRDGFDPFANREVRVAAGEALSLEIELVLAPVRESVTVKEDAAPLSLSPDSNAGAIVIRGADLDALPDDPDELAEALQALAGPAAGPNGGQIYIDGFTGGRMPPKGSIREIRLNANPFSAEFDRLGFGRIEVFTKPGSDHLRGQTSFSFNNQSLNARDPYAPNRPPYDRKEWGGNLGGPLRAGKASFFVDFEHRAVDDTAIVNGTVLDENLQIVPFSEAVVTPQWRTTVSPRLDLQLGTVHTVTLRYTHTSVDQDDAGVGGYSLPSRAYDRTNRQDTIQASDTMLLGKVVNETRFRWLRERAGQLPSSAAPALQVLDAFTGGGPQVGASSNDQDRLELQNVTSWTHGAHSFRAGLRARTVGIDDESRQNFGGTVTFAGALPALTSIERYQRTVALEQLGLSPEAIRLLGGGASQLQIAGGEPLATVHQWDLGTFLQDDWKVRSDLLLGLGLRVESQDNIGDHFDLAPRASFAWSPGAAGRSGAPKTVVRGGFGLFYDRVGEGLSLDAERLDGTSHQTFLVTDPAVLDQLSFPPDGTVAGIPSISDLVGFAQPQVTRTLDPGLRAPRTLQASLSVERALPANFTVTASWILARTDRALRSVVLASPVSAEVAPASVYQYESNGHFHQDQLVVNVNNRLNPKLSLFLSYFLNRARSDTDGSSSFPADSDDLAAEWGRAAIDARHRNVLGARVDGPWGLRASPFVIFGTGRPFNITTGRDNNRDTVFTDRPAFASDPAMPGEIVTLWGTFDPTPLPGEPLIPRNLGDGPTFFVVNLRISKTIAFGRAAAPADAPPPDRGLGRGGRGIGRGGVGRGGAGEARGLTFSLSAQNLLNHTNPAAPVGNLSSELFGESTATAGGFGFGRGGGSLGSRRIELLARFGF